MSFRKIGHDLYVMGKCLRDINVMFTRKDHAIKQKNVYKIELFIQ